VAVNAVGVGFDPDMGIEARCRCGCARNFRMTDVGRAVNDLPLQVRQADMVIIDNADGADSGSGQILDQRRTEAAGPNHQDTCLFQPCLAGATDFRQNQMAGITLDFVWLKAHGLLCRPALKLRQRQSKKLGHQTSEGRLASDSFSCHRQI
jgi:hypothetical protein